VGRRLTGPARQVYEYRFLASASIEEKVFQRQLSKEGLASIVSADKVRALSGLAHLGLMFWLEIPPQSSLSARSVADPVEHGHQDGMASSFSKEDLKELFDCAGIVSDIPSDTLASFKEDGGPGGLDDEDGEGKGAKPLVALTVRPAPGRALQVLYSESVFYGGFLWACGRLATHFGGFGIGRGRRTRSPSTRRLRAKATSRKPASRMSALHRTTPTY
jgi:hypothetical protein